MLLGAGCLTLASCRTDGKSATADSARSARVTASDSGASGRVVGGDARGAILFLGTSITAGYGLEPDSAFTQQIQRKIDSVGLAFRVVNAGVSGETSAGLLRRLDWILQQPARVIVVETGANDGLRGQSVAVTQATIGKVLATIRERRPEARVALVQMEALPNFGAEYTRAFHAMFPALAKEYGVTLLPFLLERVAGFPSLNQADGIHPNYAGERIVAENVWTGLEPLLTNGNPRRQQPLGPAPPTKGMNGSNPKRNGSAPSGGSPPRANPSTTATIAFFLRSGSIASRRYVPMSYRG